jgi:hypothetical protein
MVSTADVTLFDWMYTQVSVYEGSTDRLERTKFVTRLLRLRTASREPLSGESCWDSLHGWPPVDPVLKPVPGCGKTGGDGPAGLLPGGIARDVQLYELMLCKRASESGHSRVMPKSSVPVASEKAGSAVMGARPVSAW